MASDGLVGRRHWQPNENRLSFKSGRVFWFQPPRQVNASGNERWGRMGDTLFLMALWW
jgi:hypothetical protein